MGIVGGPRSIVLIWMAIRRELVLQKHRGTSDTSPTHAPSSCPYIEIPSDLIVVL